MNSELVRHQTVHLNNPSVNYIRLENCEYCKYERRKSYRNRYRSNPTVIPVNINVREYNPYNYIQNYNYTFYNVPTYEPPEQQTTLKKINDCTTLEINPKDTFCSICQDTIDKSTIVRTLSCGHKFHQKCGDKWLENNSNCPVCRNKL